MYVNMMYKLPKQVSLMRKSWHYVVACLMDLSFVVDCSGSMIGTNPPGIDNWQFIIDFMVQAVRLFNLGENGTHVGAVSFGRYMFFQNNSSL